MRPVIYSCPITGRRVPALVDESDIIKWKRSLLLDCPKCNRPHGRFHAFFAFRSITKASQNRHQPNSRT